METSSHFCKCFTAVCGAKSGFRETTLSNTSVQLISRKADARIFIRFAQNSRRIAIVLDGFCLLPVPSRMFVCCFPVIRIRYVPRMAGVMIRYWGAHDLGLILWCLRGSCKKCTIFDDKWGWSFFECFEMAKPHQQWLCNCGNNFRIPLWLVRSHLFAMGWAFVQSKSQSLLCGAANLLPLGWVWKWNYIFVWMNNIRFERIILFKGEVARV